MTQREIEKLLREKLKDFTLTSFRSLSFRGISGDVHWTAFYEFFQEEGYINSEYFDRWKQFIKSGIWDGILLQGVAIVFPKPLSMVFEEVATEDRTSLRRFHNTKGPALVWKDGYKLYYIRGVQVPGKYVEKPESITRNDILSQGNVEVRKAMIELVGMERFLKMFNATEIDSDTDASGMPRRLWKVEVDGERRTIIEVECPSKRDKHYLWMPGEMKTCSQAIAWSFGFEVPDNYSPDIEA